eukprot:1234039-Heterocapsa_arctica.AAC.1
MEIRRHEWMTRWSKRDIDELKKTAEVVTSTRKIALDHIADNPEEAHISLEQLDQGLRKFVSGTAAAAS